MDIELTRERIVGFIESNCTNAHMLQWCLDEIDRQKAVIRAISSEAYGNHTNMITAQQIGRIIRGEER